MTSGRHRRSWSMLLTITVSGGLAQFAMPRTLHAEEDSATEIAAARTLAVDGLKLAQAGKCDEAVPKLERSEKLHHSTIVLSRLGECNVSLGKLVEGSEQLRKVLREPLPQNPTPALSKAYERAQTALDSAKPRIASLTVSLSKAAPPDLHLMVDGQAVPAALIDNELPADPGEHTIEASAPGYLKATARVSLSSADKKTVSLKLELDPNAPVVAPHASEAPAAGRPAPEPSATPAAAPEALGNSPATRQPEPSHAAAYVAWGMGVVGVGVGSAFGIIAMKDKNEIVGRCGSNSCSSDSSASLDSAKRAGNISTVAFGVGGAGLLLGTILYFSVGGSSSQTGAVAPPRIAGLSHGRALIGPGSLQLAADF